MPVDDDDFTFEGNSSTEAERFITWVRKKARSEGKLRDQEWILDLVSSSLGGTALRWYIAQDPAVQGSWALLQPAILNHWSDAGALSVSLASSSVIPTPAAAPPPSPTSSRRSNTISFRTGRIRVFGTPKPTYISRKLNDTWGDLLTCTSKKEALQVRYTPSESPHGIEILNGGTGCYKWLGVGKSATKPTSDGEDSVILWVTTATAPHEEPFSSSVKKVEARNAVWNVSPYPDGVIRVTWDDEVFAKVAYTQEQSWSFFVGNYDVFIASPKKFSYSEARLVFEPL